MAEQNQEALQKGNRGKYKRTVRNLNKDSRPQAHGKYLRVSDLKARVVLDQIKNKDVKSALALLTYSPRHASELIEKVLRSAMANAEHNLGMDLDNLFVEEAIANKGPVMKRIRPKAKGRAFPILKRTSHITIILNERKRG
ncbi:MAG: 50S ribosomal protein L22 [Defluviitaleaceae bacterium]|nr:50S ribosomal protein L22 [Defluviitaleaceae bacterium]